LPGLVSNIAFMRAQLMPDATGKSDAGAPGGP
jgi:hypothetical protein